MLPVIVQGLTAALTELIIDRTQSLSQEHVVIALRRNLTGDQLDTVEKMVNRPELFCPHCKEEI